MPEPTELMQRSPLDAAGAPAPQASAPAAVLPLSAPQLVQLTASVRRKWRPSRYNTRATDEDGRMVLWNTLTGKISAFEPDQVAAVEELLRRDGIPGPLDRLGQYLADRGFLIPSTTDEKQQLQYEFGREHYRNDALHLILLASEDCNFRCVYCYEDFQRGTMSPEVREGVKRYVTARAPELRELSIGWFGGEPLYGMAAVEDLAPFFQQLAAEHGIAYNVHMTTNGYLLTPEVAQRLFAWDVRDFQITLDGTAELHDQKRRGRDGSGTFDVILANLQAMQRTDERFHVTLRVNFDQENYPHFAEFFQVLARSFADDERFTMSFQAIGKWGGPNDAELATCGIQETKQVLAQLRSDAMRQGLGVVTGGGVKHIRVGSQVCYAARPFSFIVGADGKLMKCTVALDKQDYNIVGRIRPDGEMVLDAERFATWVQPAFSNDSTCGGCHMSPTCQGMYCPLIRIRDKQRPCPDVKHSLRGELLHTLRAGREAAVQVTV